MTCIVPTCSHLQTVRQSADLRMNLSLSLFQDLCQLTNGEQPYWLIGIIEMTRTFGLELLESVLKGYPNIFLKVC